MGPIPILRALRRIDSGRFSIRHYVTFLGAKVADGQRPIAILPTLSKVGVFGEAKYNRGLKRENSNEYRYGRKIVTNQALGAAPLSPRAAREKFDPITDQ